MQKNRHRDDGMEARLSEAMHGEAAERSGTAGVRGAGCCERPGGPRLGPRVPKGPPVFGTPGQDLTSL